MSAELLFLHSFFLLFKKSVIVKDNIDIFIGTHRTFDPPVTNPVYKIIVGNHDIENHSNLELIKCGNPDDVIDDRFYSEIYMLKWLIKNRELKDYVGFCHYRKYFAFMDDIPDMDEIFNEVDAVTAEPIRFPHSIAKTYALAHNIEDLAIAGVIIKHRYPEYGEAFMDVTQGKLLMPYNMVIMKREDFIRCIEFVSGVLDWYVKIIGTDIEARIKSKANRYLKKFPPNNSIDYQYRIGGYLAERLTTTFIRKNFKKVVFFPVKITEKKYDVEYGNKTQKEVWIDRLEQTLGDEDQRAQDADEHAS